MPSLLVFFVAYVGIGGKDAGAIDRQVRSALEDQSEVQDVDLDAKKRKALVARADAAADIVRGLGSDGVIAGEVKRTKKKATLTIVVFDGDGSFVDLLELPLAKKKSKKLSKVDLESVRESLLPAIERLAPPPPPAPEPTVAEATETDEPAVVATAAPAPRRRREPLLRISAGAGPRKRTFEPGPAMVLGYRSNPVPGGQVAVEVRPIRYVAIGGELERTLVMTSQVESEDVPTSILGWQATAAGRLPLGPFELAALTGIGGREFVIASAMPSGTPDGHYLYALLGGRIAARLGSRIELRAFAAFEPVVGGDDTMGNTAARSGIEVGAALQIDATRRLFVLGEGGYQRFTWTFDEGQATDEYPSATLSLGATY